MRTFALLLSFALASPVLPADTPVGMAVHSAARPAKDIAADPVRKPAETLAFSGVKPGMKVGEFYPGSGYFTRMISDVVGPKGHVYAIENSRWNKDVKPDGGTGKANVTAKGAAFGTVDFPEPLDLAWVTQNYHDLKIAEYGVVDTAAFNKAVFAALKPGGTYMIVDHEAKPGLDVAGITKLHRIDKRQVIEEVTAAGFRLAGEGRFLAHPGDDHSLSIFDKKIQGQSDQYALKFVKPR